MSGFDRDINSILAGSGSLYSARRIAVGLSLFLAACSSPGVKVPAPDALGNNKSSHILEPQFLTDASVREITLEGVYPGGKLTPDVLAPFDAFSPGLQQVDLAYCNLEGGLHARHSTVKEGDNDADCYLFQATSGYLAHFPQTGFESLSLASTYARHSGEDEKHNDITVTKSENIPHASKERDTTNRIAGDQDVIVVALHSRAGAETRSSYLSRYQYLPPYAGFKKNGRSAACRVEIQPGFSPAAPIPDEQHHTTRLATNLTLAGYAERPLIIDERTGISLTSPATFSGAPPSLSA